MPFKDIRSAPHWRRTWIQNRGGPISTQYQGPLPQNGKAYS